MKFEAYLLKRPPSLIIVLSAREDRGKIEEHHRLGLGGRGGERLNST